MSNQDLSHRPNARRGGNAAEVKMQMRQIILREMQEEAKKSNNENQQEREEKV